MAVNRLWFPNAPVGLVNKAQKTQLAIGYSGISIIDPLVLLVAYFRRYLNDL